MPYEWVDPEVFVEYNGVTVYHVYKNNHPMYYHFCTDPGDCEDDSNMGGTQFDVRDLKPVYTVGSRRWNMEYTIKAAIDSGELS